MKSHVSKAYAPDHFSGFGFSQVITMYSDTPFFDLHEVWFVETLVDVIEKG